MDLLQDGAGGVEKGNLSDKANGFRHEQLVDLRVILDQTVLQMTCRRVGQKRKWNSKKRNDEERYK